MKGLVGLVGWPIVDGLPTCGYPSAAGRAQDRESSPAKDRRSTAVPRNQVSKGTPQIFHVHLQIWLASYYSVSKNLVDYTVACELTSLFVFLHLIRIDVVMRKSADFIFTR